MRMSYTDLKNQFLRNIGKDGSTDTYLIADFNNRLAQRYQMVFSMLQDYQTAVTKTASTVASQQYYSYPLGVSKTDDVVVTVGSVKYPLTPIHSQHQWDVLNAIQIQPSAIPQFIFIRRNDFGIWPIPQDAYTITFNHFIRDRSLLVEDYTTGTVTVTNGDATITGDSTTWTAAMVGRWFEITDTTNVDYGWWYRISSFTNTTSIELENTWQGTTNATLTYRIAQTPEIPEEGHIMLSDGVTADYYAGMRSDIEKATWWNNVFWTGDGNNNNRKIGDDNIKAGVIGLVNKYSSRDESSIVNRQPKVWPPQYKVWGTTLS